jgi:malic enzyme
MQAELTDKSRVWAAQVFVDSQGLLYEGRTIADEHKLALTLPNDLTAQYGFTAQGAGQRLATLVSKERLEVGAIYPDQSELRAVSASIAEAVVRHVDRQQPSRESGVDDIAELVNNAMWYPAYEN